MPPPDSMRSEKKPVGSSKTVKVGPWGGQGGSPWDDGCFNGVREITLAYGQCIDSIRIQYDRSGKPVLAEKHGGNGGSHTLQIKLQYPQEFLTAVSGHYSPVSRGGAPVIRSLTFQSNQKTFGPFGAEEGTPFTFPMEGGMIVGFSGRSGRYLDAVGLHLAPIRFSNLYDAMQQKLHKIGAMASKSLGNPKGEHGSRAGPKARGSTIAA